MSRFFVLALAAVGAVLMTAVPLQAAERNAYTVTPLVSDQETLAGPPDATLVNAWGARRRTDCERPDPMVGRR